MICLTCGKENDAQTELCRHCGSRLIGWQSGAQPGAEPGLPEVAPATEEPLYAGFWRRFLAIVIDEILLGIIALIFTTSYLLTVMSGQGLEGLEITALGSWIFRVLLHWLYFTLMESSPKQATVGKMAIGIIVTGYDGKRISFPRANGRYFGKFLSALFFGIGFIMAGMTKKKQALHDMLAETLVVMKL